MNITATIKEEILSFSKDLGFDLIGFTNKSVDETAQSNYNRWLENNYNGSMSYMERNIELRFNPSLIFDGYKSMIVVALNYFNDSETEGIAPYISDYAYGRDYHKTIKGMLKKLSSFLAEKGIKSRAFTDSAPVLEKYFAQKAGIGWLGKNGLIINKKLGSMFFLGELLVDIDLGNSQEMENYCGKCTKCIESCPTNAIVEERVIDSNQCISYLTIEQKEIIPKTIKKKIPNLIFGCDICQKVCPWNKKAQKNKISDFNFRYKKLNLEKLSTFTKEEFEEVFRGSTIRRANYEHFMRQVKRVQKLNSF
jgi:epoxyqueuosine reductase